MRALLVGLGSIGTRHLENLRHLEPAAEITILRHRRRPLDETYTHPVQERVVYSLEEALDTRPDIALLTNPASHHVHTGLSLAQQDVHLFIEKPLSNGMDGVNELIDLCAAKSLVLMVGYVLRFNPSLRVLREAMSRGGIGHPLSIRAEVGQFLPHWRPSIDYRHSVSASRDLGGGVLLELSHELDYVRWLAGEVSAVNAQVGRLSDLEIDVDDVAEIILRFENGMLGSVHLDMVRQPPTRNCEVIGTEGTVLWDGLSGQTQIYSSSTKTWTDISPPDSITPNDMYMAELRHFLSCVRRMDTPIVDGDDGRAALRLAIAAETSSQQGVEVQL